MISPFTLHPSPFTKKTPFTKTILLLLVALTVCSCGSIKNYAYLQNIDTVNLDSTNFLYDARIMPKDILTISVTSFNQEAAAPFNKFSGSNGSNYGYAGGMGQNMYGYLVDNEGCIEFPVIGFLHVVGLTKRECEAMILDSIKPYFNEAEKPLVTVRTSSYSVTVLGEVGSPGVIQVAREKINVFEALAQAGDITVYGVRDHVKLIRENAQGHKEVHDLDLSQADFLNNPYFYLQQNDIVYVEPKKVKARNAYRSIYTNFWLSIPSTLLSAIAIYLGIKNL